MLDIFYNEEVIEVNESFNVGFGPTSVWVELFNYSAQDYKRSIDNIISDITLFGCSDVIFHGSIHSNKEALLWVVPRLLAHNYTVTILINLSDEKGLWKVVDVIAHRVIVVVNEKNFKENLSMISKLREVDRVIIDVGDVRKLIKFMEMLLRVNAKIVPMYSKLAISIDNIIEANLYDLEGAGI